MAILDPSGTGGMTQRELLLEVRQDIKELQRSMARKEEEHDEIHTELREMINSRPSRAEIVGLFAMAGTISGFVFAIIQVVR